MEKSPTITTTISTPPAAEKATKYVGPKYTTGLLLPGMSRPVQPAEFKPEEIKAFLVKYPDRAGWWKNPPAPSPAK